MTETSIQAFQSNDGALSAEHYQTFEMAKANDDVLGGDDIAQIRSYAAYARAQAQAIHKTIAATSGIDDVAAIKAEATETAQTFAKVGIYADQRIGEILRELPKGKGNQYTSASVDTPTKAQAEKDAGISHGVAVDLQKLAANPEVVEAVIARATEEGKVVSRSQVLKAIRERDMYRVAAANARGDLDDATARAANLQSALSDARQEIAALERQNDALFAQKNPEPKVVERTVEVESEASRRRIAELEHEVSVYLETDQKLRSRNEEMRKELDRAKDILGMDKGTKEVQRDVEYLIGATNAYIRRYGGYTWTVERIADVDATTREELRKAARNLATFSNALVASLEQM